MLRSCEMRIEEWLAILKQRFRVEIALVAAGLTHRDRQRLVTEIEESIILELAHQVLPEREMLAEAERLFLAELLGRRFSLPASVLARARHPRHVGGLNEREAICLWLGLFRQQTFGLAGLWQMYLDVEDTSIPLPEVVQQVFDPQGNDGENQDYISKILEEARQAGLDLTDKDTSKIIAWIVETNPQLHARDPVEVARELQGRRSRPVAAVDQNLLRGGNTLMDEFVRRVYWEIHNC